MTNHADDEALSAFVDGQAPEWSAHVAGCPSCLVAVETLRAVAAAVSVPVPPSAPEARDRAIAAAMAVGVT
ncbi:MAG: hypothetical protein M3Y04_05625, partial [Actinomycetota bacterium]|nr:hypothetical protein [Actinomycetota bacterium]